MNSENNFRILYSSTPILYIPTNLLKHTNISVMAAASQRKSTGIKKAGVGRLIEEIERELKDTSNFGRTMSRDHQSIREIIKDSDRMSEREAEEITFGRLEDIDLKNIDHVLKEARRGKKCRIPKVFEVNYVEKDAGLQWKINQLTLLGFIVDENKINVNKVEVKQPLPEDKLQQTKKSRKLTPEYQKIEFVKEKKKSFFERFFK